MGQILHGSATTTHTIRAAIKRSQASNAALSRESERRRRPTGSPRRRCPSPLPAAIQSRSQPYRDDVRQAQGSRPQGRGTNRRGNMATDWNPPERIPT